ncbi:hypothetical protein C1H46_021525 [Malus baccata]|uniref:CN hydrolase domain-containing protein n=1 Tax=Malus baccata TaxID=106549 RepID=A0A540M285_MALBA|nr:hypothetical protein C1H46_021525 [Malus baccata]
MAMGIAECTEGSGVSGVMTEEVAGIVEKVGTMEAILVKGGVFVGPGVGKTGLRVIIERLGRWRGVKSLKRGFLQMSREISFKESDFFSTGDQTTIVDTDFIRIVYELKPLLSNGRTFAEVGRIGVGICHDLRFPELAALYRKKGVHIICNPGAFNMSTGELLWELVQRARAVDNRSGEIIATAGHEETIVIAKIDYSKIQLQRKSLQLDEQKREDIYKLIDVHELSP